MLNETCIQLLEIIDQQEEMISKQNQTIKALTMEKLEQEAIISELMRGYQNNSQ